MSSSIIFNLAPSAPKHTVAAHRRIPDTERLEETMRFAAFLVWTGILVAQNADLSGGWIVNINRFGEPDYSRLNLEAKEGHYRGKLWGDVQLDGIVKGDAIEFQCSHEEDKQTKVCGSL